MLVRSLRRAGLLSAALACLIALAILLSLGTWQLGRRTWKEQLLASMQQRSLAEPITGETWRQLACTSTSMVIGEDPCDFRPVRLRLAFIANTERHIFISVPMQADGIGGPGYWVFQRARIEGGDPIEIYVNRGFVPQSLKRAERAAAPPEIAGLLRRAEPRNRFSNANDIAGNVFYVRDPIELGGLEKSASVGPSPQRYYIDMIGPTPASGLPRPLVGQISIPNRHLEYALTWYALAATLLGVFAAFARKRLRDD